MTRSTFRGPVGSGMRLAFDPVMEGSGLLAALTIGLTTVIVAYLLAGWLRKY